MPTTSQIIEVARSALTDAAFDIIDTRGEAYRINAPRSSLAVEGDVLTFGDPESGDHQFVTLAANELAGAQLVTCSTHVVQVAFWDALPPEVRDLLEPTVRSLGPHGESLARAALRSYPRRIDDELRGLCEQLTDGQREAVCAAVEVAMREPSELLLGWLLAAGLAATPATVLLLGDLLVGCREGNVTRRAAFALDALLLCGTTEAHMQIQRVAFEATEPAVIAWAQHALMTVAHDKRVPVWEVEDELVPVCGLERGAPTLLRHREHTLALALDEHLRPYLLDRDTRHRHYDLPHDAPDATRWRVLREQLLEAVPVQVHRLEQALALEYRWKSERWLTGLLRHPLMRHIVTRCVWGRYTPGGHRLEATFRVEGDLTLWGPDDEPFELDSANCTTGLVHPIDLDDATRLAWERLLADYEVVTCFPQLDRPVFRFEPDEARSSVTEVRASVVDCRVDPLAHLHRRGWRSIDSWRGQLGKTFRSRDVQAKADIAYDDHGHLAEVTAVSFQRYLGYPRSDFELRDVPPIVFSEALYEFHALQHASDTGAFVAVVAP